MSDHQQDDASGPFANDDLAEALRGLEEEHTLDVSAHFRDALASLLRRALHTEARVSRLHPTRQFSPLAATARQQVRLDDLLDVAAAGDEDEDPWADLGPQFAAELLLYAVAQGVETQEQAPWGPARCWTCGGPVETSCACTACLHRDLGGRYCACARHGGASDRIHRVRVGTERDAVRIALPATEPAAPAGAGAVVRIDDPFAGPTTVPAGEGGEALCLDLAPSGAPVEPPAGATREAPAEVHVEDVVAEAGTPASPLCEECKGKAPPTSVCTCGGCRADPRPFYTCEGCRERVEVDHKNVRGGKAADWTPVEAER